MQPFVGKLNDTFDKVNKFFCVTIQRPEPSQKTIRMGSLIGIVLGLFMLIFGIIGGFKWGAIGGSLMASSNLVNLLSKKKS
ncbi:hypothetical protein CSE16_13450 [Solibacillus sp. R5-41]|uniref:hypothetical protein n=1 Tax=Solibacillus sp. R5-41 TaxID=2048654 RepID=UPI000C126742|nr:hypothetical protein [Solibacillus sp. R5-41]ATP40977.1 hypothetical protein CSE16_13450 [Solibacillus sp. R5-41]